MDTTYDATLRGDAIALALIGVALLVRAGILIGQARRPDGEELHGEDRAARYWRGVRTGIVAPLFFVGAFLTQVLSRFTLY